MGGQPTGGYKIDEAMVYLQLRIVILAQGRRLRDNDIDMVSENVFFCVRTQPKFYLLLFFFCKFASPLTIRQLISTARVFGSFVQLGGFPENLIDDHWSTDDAQVLQRFAYYFYAMCAWTCQMPVNQTRRQYSVYQENGWVLGPNCSKLVNTIMASKTYSFKLWPKKWPQRNLKELFFCYRG